MPDDLLFPEDVAALAGKPPAEVAKLILTGEVGPLRSAPMPADAAAVAYLVYLAFRGARRKSSPKGMLANATTWDAWATTRGRLKSAVSRSGSLEQFGVRFFESMGLDIAALRTEDMLWWRRTVASIGDDVTWFRLASDVAQADAATGAQIINDALWQLHSGKED